MTGVCQGDCARYGFTPWARRHSGYAAFRCRVSGVWRPDALLVLNLPGLLGVDISRKRVLMLSIAP